MVSPRHILFAKRADLGNSSPPYSFPSVLTDGESASFSIESISFNTTDDRFFILDATEITRAWQSAIPAVIDWTCSAVPRSTNKTVSACPEIADAGGTVMAITLARLALAIPIAAHISLGIRLKPVTINKSL